MIIKVCTFNNMATKEAKFDRTKGKIDASRLDLKIWMHQEQAKKKILGYRRFLQTWLMSLI